MTYLTQVLISKHSMLNIKDEDIYVLKGEGTRPDGGFLEVRLDRENVLETILKVFYVEKTDK